MGTILDSAFGGLSLSSALMTEVWGPCIACLQSLHGAYIVIYSREKRHSTFSKRIHI